MDYEEIARDLESRNDEWYHALISIDDLPIVLSIPNLKVYAWCRCKLIGTDGTEAHHHWHGLVHFSSGKLASWKTKAWRHKIKFSSKKNTFKRIICLDHAVGVLRYVACSQGQVSRRGADGLLPQRHTHYARQPISQHHRHKKGKDCAVIRDWISVKIARPLDLKEKLIGMLQHYTMKRHALVIEVTLLGRKRKKQMKKDGNIVDCFRSIVS